MEDTTLLLITLLIGVFGTLLAYLFIRERAEDRRERRRMTSSARAARHPPKTPQGEPQELGGWVPQLLESFGVDEDVLFEEDMPEELRTLLPLAKGFIQSGGLEKLLKKNTPPTEEGEENLNI
jgi:hypothetical protein